MISDKELQRLRMQSEFNSFGTRAPEEWRKMAEALAELEERRKKDRPLVRAHGPDCQCGICRRILVPNEQLE